jgi:MFS family permease
MALKGTFRVAPATAKTYLDKQSGYYKWFLVGVLFVVACLNYADRGALNAIFPLLRKQLGMSDVSLAATSSFFLWSYALCSPFAGYIGDRFSRSAVITWGLAAWSLLMVLTGLAQSESQLLVMRVPLGIAESLYVPASIALIADHHPTSSRGTAFSVHLCGFYAGVVVGGWLSGYIGQAYGWRYALITLGVLGLLFAAFASRVLRDRPRLKSADGPPVSIRPAISLLEISRVRSFWFLLIESFLFAAVIFILNTWLPLFFHEAFGMSLARAGFLGNFSIQAGAVIGVLLGGWISDVVGRKNSRNRLLIQVCSDLVSAPLLLVFLLMPNATLVQLVLFAFTFIRFAGGANANPLICDLIRAEHRALAFGITNLTNCLSAGAAVLLSGMLKGRFGLTAIFGWVSILALVSGLFLLVGYCFFLRADFERSGAQAGDA